MLSFQSPSQTSTTRDVLQPHGRGGWGTLQGLVQERVLGHHGDSASSQLQRHGFLSPTFGPLGPSWEFLSWANANGPDRFSEINGQKVA